MQSIPCPSPRADRQPVHGASRFPVHTLGVLALGLALSAASGCGLLIPDPDDCPDVLCDADCTQVEGDDGCFTCECPAPPRVCFEDGDCGAGQRCDTENFCEAPPGCVEGQPCPDVCYGLCVDEPTGCTSDSDCANGEICRPGAADAAARPAAPEEDVPEQLPEPTGVCVPASCGDDPLPLPACPPGTELQVRFDDDECGHGECIPVDGCRSLDPDACAAAPGCHLETLPSDCNCGGSGVAPGDGEADPAACYCPDEGELICVANEACRDLDPQSCAQDPDCEGQWYWVSDCDADGAAERPAPDCDPSIDGCGTGCVEYEEFACFPRTDNGCQGNWDCPVGYRCEQQSSCAEVCWEAEDGTSGCEVDCWTDDGQCVPAGTDDCWNLPYELCLERPDCEVLEVPVPCECGPNGDCACPDGLELVCVPAQPASCWSDFDCGPGQYCDLIESCPDCGGNGDIDCGAPCFIEGVCRDGDPIPTECRDDADCGPGFGCQVVTVCGGGCTDTSPGFPDEPAPPPCQEECWDEGICVPTDPVGDLCWTDEDCGGGQRCDTENYCEGPPDCPNCLIACMGRCVDDGPPPDICYSSGDCADDEYCTVETGECLGDPTCPECDVCVGRCEPRPTDICMSDDECGPGLVCDNVNYCESPICDPGTPCPPVCYGRCVEPQPPPGACLADSDCGAGERCATELDVCYCGPNGCSDGQCYSMCVEVQPGGLCSSDLDCGNGQQCDFADPACVPDPNGFVPFPGCEGICVDVTDPPPPGCFSDFDCNQDEVCLPDPGCPPGVDFCPSTCQPLDCVQVEQAAINPDTQSCVVFPTPCDVPDGWILVNGCSP